MPGIKHRVCGRLPEDMYIAPSILRHYKRIDRVLKTLDPAASPWALVLPDSQEPRGNIIVFPGSFNPPTLAHLALLRQAHTFARRQGGQHWQLYAALSKYSVDKEAVERMTLLDRVALLERVLRSQGQRVGILLLNRGLYVEQAQGIRAAFPQVCSLYFLVGFDKIVQILDPRYYTERDAALHELFSLAHLLVAPRGTAGKDALTALLARPENRPFARFIHALPLEERYLNISSTQARQNQEAQADELPGAAREFLARTRPYATPTREVSGNDLYAQRTRMLQALLRNASAGRSGDWHQSG
ncbi:MAG TPA: hypothetical protein VFV38_48160 [Ktedonobacteraceae bacterium]|nr:hypothetical protein [Ktedonobacteraceae bacterium]